MKPVGRPIALAFRCINAKEVDEVYGRIAAAGVLDPDGNAVDLFAELPKS